MASWWNPFTWKIFHKPVGPKIEQQIITTTIPPVDTSTQTIKEEPKKSDQPVEVEKLKKKVEASKTEIKSEQKDDGVTLEIYWKNMEDSLFPIADGQGLIKFKAYNPRFNDNRYYTKENGKWVWSSSGSDAIQLFGSANIICNGKKWTSCPIGNNFYCPEKGDVSCIDPNNSTLCNGKYWKNCTGGKEFYCPTSGNAQCNTSLVEIEALIRQAKNIADNNTALINNQNALNTKLRLEELAREAETARVNAEIIKLKNQLEESQNKKITVPIVQLPSINCSNYQTEKNNIDNRHEQNGTVFSSARNSEMIALDAKYASCF